MGTVFADCNGSLLRTTNRNNRNKLGWFHQGLTSHFAGL